MADTQENITYVEEKTAVDTRPIFTIKKIDRKNEAVYTVEIQVSGVEESLIVDVAPLKMDSSVEVLTALGYTAKNAAGLDGSIMQGAEKPYFPVREDKQEIFQEGESFTII